MIKQLIKLLLMVSVIIISTGCGNDNQIDSNSITLSDYLIIKASNDLLNTNIVISTYDENGNKVDEKNFKAASAWNTKYSNDYVAVIGSDNLTLINIVTGRIVRVNADLPIDYTYIKDDLLTFVINAGLDKESGEYLSKVCLLEIDDRSNYDLNDYRCSQIGYVPYDIVLKDENVILATSELDTLKEYLVFFDSDLNIVEQHEIKTLGSYFLSSSDESMVIYNFDEYFIYPDGEIVKTETKIDRFTFVDSFKHGFLRTNYNDTGTEIYYEEMNSNNTLTSERLFSANHLTVEGCNDSNIIALYERAMNESSIRFYDVELNEFKSFSYKIKDIEKVLGAYYTR